MKSGLRETGKKYIFVAQKNNNDSSKKIKINVEKEYEEKNERVKNVRFIIQDDGGNSRIFFQREQHLKRFIIYLQYLLMRECNEKVEDGNDVKLTGFSTGGKRRIVLKEEHGKIINSEVDIAVSDMEIFSKDEEDKEDDEDEEDE